MSRPKTALILIAILLIAFIFVGCNRVPGTTPRAGLEITDMAGREVKLEGPATRIVALTAGDCEIIFALGAGDALVGRGAYCDYPEQIFEIPALESGGETNIEQIIALEPQVVIMGTMAQTSEHIKALERAGIAVVVTDAQDISGTYEAIKLIGAVTGKNDEAAALVDEMEAGFEELKSKVPKDSV